MSACPTGKAASVALTVRETAGVDRRGWPVTAGIPFPDGCLPVSQIAAGRFGLLDANEKPVACQVEPVATWGHYPAGSNGYVKWLHVRFLADVRAGATARYRFDYGGRTAARPKTDLVVRQDAGAVTIVTGRGRGALKLVVSKERFNVLDEVWLDLAGDGFGPGDRIVAPRQQPNLWVGYDYSTAAINAHRPEVRVEEAGPVRAVVRVATKMDRRFESVVRIFAYADSPYVRIQETLIHGPTGQDRSAVQPQAVVMKAHVLELPLRLDRNSAVATIGVGEALPEPPQFTSCRIRLAEDWPVKLEQDLSHPCRKGNVGPDGLSRAFGYGLYANGRQVAAGRRAPGWLDVSDGRWGVTAAVRYFWQSFPKRLVASREGLRLEHWAQGAQLNPLSRNYNWMGMAKTHDVLLYFHPGDAALAGAEQVALGHIGEIFATCEPAYYCASRAYSHQPLAPAVQDGRRVRPEYDAFVSAALNRQRTIRDGFYYFREREDGYGYFNFGDFLVGPYWGCLEYDPTYCMIQQFYRTGELKYLEFAAECVRHNYDIDFSHTHTPQTSNYPQRSHDKRGSHFAGEDSHGQRSMNTDPGHVFIAGLVNYWFLSGDARARDVIFWSLPVYLNEDWYRMTGAGTWRYLGGYLFTVLIYGYELTWDDRYVEPMIWAARQYMVNNWSRHADGIWWSRNEAGGYICQPWLADSITNGYTQFLAVYPGYPHRQAIEQAIVRLADFLLAHCFSENFDGLHAQVLKPTSQSSGYHPSGTVYRSSMGNMAVLTLARAYHLTGDQKYLRVVRKILARVLAQKGRLKQLKPVAQGTYYAPMVLGYLEGLIGPRRGPLDCQPVEPPNNWLAACRRIVAEHDDRQGILYVGDELAAACAPPARRGRAFGNAPGWRLADVLGAIDDLLARHRPRLVVVLVGGSDLPIGHPERSDFEANSARLLGHILAAGSIPVCVTLPPCSHLEPFGWIYNAVIYQAARLNRLPLIDLHERMRSAGPAPINNEPAPRKVPPADWISQNRFVDGHQQIVTAEVAAILHALGLSRTTSR